MQRILAFCVMAVFGLMFSQSVLVSDGATQLTTAYQTYKLAMQKGDYSEARVYAKNAWDLSEANMGASKQTGDFAYNYAVLGKALAGSKRSKKVEQAFERSLELSKLHEEGAHDITLRRQVDFAAYWVQINKWKKA